MGIRLYSGSLLGLSRDNRHRMERNPFCRIFLDEKVDEKRLSKALSLALTDCPYMRLSVEEDEGIFLKLEENGEPLALLSEEPEEINAPENHGHSCAVSCRGNRITVMTSHALTDGCGFFWFIRTLLDRYFGEESGIYRGAKEKDYAADPLEQELSLEESYEPPAPAEGPFFQASEAAAPRFSDQFLLVTGSKEFHGLCKELEGSAQNVLTALCLMAHRECWPENGALVTARLPINARNLFGIPNSFQNASLANMRITLSPKDMMDPKTMVLEITRQCAPQKTRDAVAYQCNAWRRVLMAETREERMKRILPLLGQDTLLASNLGRGLISDTYAGHITAMIPGAMMFPLMVYGVPWGDRMGFSGYDAIGNGRYKAALRSVLERMGLRVEECDSATGKTI